MADWWTLSIPETFNTYKRPRPHGLFHAVGAFWYKRQAVCNRMESDEKAGREANEEWYADPDHRVQPTKRNGKKELARRVAELHADCVLSTIRGLDCSPEQKRSCWRR